MFIIIFWVVHAGLWGPRAQGPLGKFRSKGLGRSVHYYLLGNVCSLKTLDMCSVQTYIIMFVDMCSIKPHVIFFLNVFWF